MDLKSERSESTFIGDTEAGVRRICHERLRSMIPAERWRESQQLNDLTRQFIVAGIRMRHPDYDERQIHQAVARLVWGDEVYRNAFPGEEIAP